MRYFFKIDTNNKTVRLPVPVVGGSKITVSKLMWSNPSVNSGVLGIQLGHSDLNDCVSTINIAKSRYFCCFPVRGSLTLVYNITTAPADWDEHEVDLNIDTLEFQVSFDDVLLTTLSTNPVYLELLVE